MWHGSARVKACAARLGRYRGYRRLPSSPRFWPLLVLICGFGAAGSGPLLAQSDAAWQKETGEQEAGQEGSEGDAAADSEVTLVVATGPDDTQIPETKTPETKVPMAPCGGWLWQCLAPLAERQTRDIGDHSPDLSRRLEKALSRTGHDLIGTDHEIGRLSRSVESVDATLTDLEAWRPPARPLAKAAPGEEVVCLTFDAHDLPDADRAELIHVVSRQSQISRWPSEYAPHKLDGKRIRSLDDWIDEYYNLEKEHPLTRAALRAELSRANEGIELGTQWRDHALRMPPFPRLPTKPFFIFSYDGSVIYDPQRVRYGFLDEDKTAQCGSPLDRNLGNGSGTSKEVNSRAYNRTNLTSIRLRVPSGRRTIEMLSKLSLNIAASSASGLVELQLHDQESSGSGADADACDRPGRSWRTSPYFDVAAKKAKDYRATLEEAMASRRGSPLGGDLWIIDWGFGGCQDPKTKKWRPNDAHGDKVLDVAKHLLTQLNLPIMIGLGPDAQTRQKKKRQRIPQLRHLDLRPSLANERKLKDMVDAYAESLSWNFESVADEVKAWISSQADQPICTKNPVIDEFLINAAVFHILFKAPGQGQRPVYLNMSFGAPSAALQGSLRGFIRRAQAEGKNVVVLSSAGNGTPHIAPDLSPQGVALNLPQSLFNISFHGEDGEVVGTWNHEDVPVLTSAPGSGYDYQSISPCDRGSSFSSPLVATSLWLRQLIHRSGGSEGSRRSLLRASVPPDRKEPTVAGGLYDPILAVAGLGSHLLTHNDDVVELEDCQVQFSYLAPELTTVLVEKAKQGRSIRIGTGHGCPQPGLADCLWWQRSLSKTEARVRGQTTGGKIAVKESTLGLKAVSAQGETMNLEQFVAQATYLYCEH